MTKEDLIHPYHEAQCLYQHTNIMKLIVLFSWEDYQVLPGMDIGGIRKSVRPLVTNIHLDNLPALLCMFLKYYFN